MIVWIVAHWRLLLGVAGVAVLVTAGYRFGYREGSIAGYTSGINDAPRCPVVNGEVKIEPSECKTSTQVKVVYVPRTVPSPTKDCPPIVIPIPEVTYESESTGKSGGSEASVEVRQPERKADGPGAAIGGAILQPSQWHAEGFVGMGGSGLEFGGGISKRFLGPLELGVYARVPTHDVGHASGGVIVGFGF